jgi:hypothetical protein
MLERSEVKAVLKKMVEEQDAKEIISGLGEDVLRKIAENYLKYKEKESAE